MLVLVVAEIIGYPTLLESIHITTQNDVLWKVESRKRKYLPCYSFDCLSIHVCSIVWLNLKGNALVMRSIVDIRKTLLGSLLFCQYAGFNS